MKKFKDFLQEAKHFDITVSPKDKEEDKAVRIIQNAFGRAGHGQPLPNGKVEFLGRFDRKHHRENAIYLFRQLKIKYKEL